MNRINRSVFDASAVLALLLDEPGADKLRDAQPTAVVCAVNAAEVIAKLVSRGMPLRETRSALDALHLEVVPFDAIGAAVSGQFVCKGISLGDRCFLAAASEAGSGWTSDRDLGDLAGNMAASLRFFR